jgi:endoglucanase
MRIFCCLLLSGLAFLVSCSADNSGGVVTPQSSSSSEAADCTAGYVKVDYSFARGVNNALGKGINFGNGFDAHSTGQCGPNNYGATGAVPNGGWDNCWSNAIKQEYFSLIRAAGFQSIRLPVNWNTRAADESPYAINPSFMARVKEVVSQAIAEGFLVIINIHHYNALWTATGETMAKERAKFVELWRQIAEEFKDYSNDSLVFELLNEPRGNIKATQLNQMATEVWPIIRATNPGRVIMINPSEWGHFTNAPLVKVPGNDSRVILSGHYYFPHTFTHQGTSDNPTTGVPWGTEGERAKLIEDMEGTADKLACRFPDINGGSVPINIGEFGATIISPEESKVEYNKALMQSMNKYNMSWHYWCLIGCNFDVYSKNSSTWNQAVLKSLIP